MANIQASIFVTQGPVTTTHVIRAEDTDTLWREARKAAKGKPFRLHLTQDCLGNDLRSLRLVGVSENSA